MRGGGWEVYCLRLFSVEGGEGDFNHRTRLHRHAAAAEAKYIEAASPAAATDGISRPQPTTTPPTMKAILYASAFATVELRAKIGTF